MPVRTTIFTATLLTLSALTAVPSPAKEIVEIRVRGHYFAAPATVPLVVAVEPGERNYVLAVEADGEGYYRASEIELNGEKEKRSTLWSSETCRRASTSCAHRYGPRAPSSAARRPALW